MKTTLKNILNRPIIWIFLYLTFVLIYTLCFWLGDSIPKVMLASNELGDFLAGVFAPIAFLYLFLSYKQQEKALAKTNADLLQQLEIQKDMLKLQVASQRAKEHSALPIIDHYFTLKDLPFDTDRINPHTSRPYESFNRRISMNFDNSGQMVSQVNILCIAPFKKTIIYNHILSKSEPIKTNIMLKESQLEEHDTDGFIDLNIHLEYCTSLGIRYVQYYEITISSNRETITPIIQYTAKSNPIRMD